MSKFKSNSYYIYDKFSNHWVFKHTPNNEIVYEVYNNQQKKIHSAVLTTECASDFVINSGDKNDIHIITRKISGDVLYYFFNGKKWNALKLFNLGQHKDSFHLLGFHLWKNQTHILYSMQNPPGSNNWLLIDQHWENNKWNYIKFFQTSKDPFELDFTSIHDNSGNIYFTCQWWDGVEHQIQLCQFHSKVNLWNKSTLTFKKGEKYAPSIWITDDQKVHTCWISFMEEEQYSLRYRRKGSSSNEGNKWEQEIALYTSPNKIQQPFLGQFHNKLTIFWLENQNLYYIQSDNTGDTWDSSPKLLSQLSDPDIIFYLSQNTEMKDESFYIILDKANLQIYPLSFLSAKKEIMDFIPSNLIQEQTNLQSQGPSTNTYTNSFYPSPQSKGSPNTHKFSAFNSDGKRTLNSSSNPTTKKIPIEIDTVKALNETFITNLTEEKAKAYLIIFKNYLIQLYEENKVLKKQVVVNSNKRPPTSHPSKPFYVPSSFEQSNKDDGKQVIKERLKTKIIEDENTKLKSDISEYKNILQQMQKDLKGLKYEINNMDSENKKLQNEVLKIKENTLKRKISRFFMGD